MRSLQTLVWHGMRALPPRLASALLALTVSVLFAGCSTVNNGIGEYAHVLVQRHRIRLPSAQTVAANPYPQLYVRTPDGQATLVLGNVDGQREDWYGHGNVVVFLRHGQVIKTTGLATNLHGLLEPSDNAFARGLQHLSGPVTYTRYEDWPDYRYGIPVTAQLDPVGTTQITILGVRHNVLHVRETLSSRVTHYRAVNQYWVDTSDGLIWKSIQHVAPGESIVLIQLKPYTRLLP